MVSARREGKRIGYRLSEGFKGATIFDIKSEVVRKACYISGFDKAQKIYEAKKVSSFAGVDAEKDEIGIAAGATSGDSAATAKWPGVSLDKLVNRFRPD